MNRPVLIKILVGARIDEGPSKRRFIGLARALARIEHANVQALLDYGATEAGAPYHVMAEADVDLATLLASEGRVSWARTRTILLDVIAGVHALHRQAIIHGDISPRTVALFGETARLIDFGDADLHEHEPTPEELSVDVHGIAALGFLLATGSSPTGRARSLLEAELARSEAPPSVQRVLLQALTDPRTVDLASLRRELGGETPPSASSRTASRMRTRLVDVAAAMAAATMLSIGLWSSVLDPCSETPAHERALESNSARAGEEGIENSGGDGRQSSCADADLFCAAGGGRVPRDDRAPERLRGHLGEWPSR